MSPPSSYGPDLAHIHDTGFGDFARRSAPGVLAILRRAGVEGGRVVDLGCGSGIWARELGRAGYDVVGFDISRSMLRIARRRAPRATFRIGSFLDVDLPACRAVTALGECFNYRLDDANGRAALRKLFRRVHRVLEPGGVLVFDVAEPGRVPGGAARRHWEGDGWAILVDARERGRKLVRQMTTFRRVGKSYRRSEETHRLNLYRGAELAADLRAIGFRVRTVRSWGDLRLVRGHVGLIARKP